MNNELQALKKVNQNNQVDAQIAYSLLPNTKSAIRELCIRVDQIADSFEEPGHHFESREEELAKAQLALEEIILVVKANRKARRQNRKAKAQLKDSSIEILARIQKLKKMSTAVMRKFFFNAYGEGMDFTSLDQVTEDRQVLITNILAIEFSEDEISKASHLPEVAPYAG